MVYRRGKGEKQAGAVRWGGVGARLAGGGSGSARQGIEDEEARVWGFSPAGAAGGVVVVYPGVNWRAGRCWPR